MKCVCPGLVEQTPGLIIDYDQKSQVRFAVQEWDVPVLTAGEGWGANGRMLMFYFGNQADKLKLYLDIGPGPSETRQRLFNYACATKPPFAPPFKTLNAKWNAVYVRTWLSASALEEATIGEIESTLHQKWENFLMTDFLAIKDALRKEDWLGTK